MSEIIRTALQAIRPVSSEDLNRAQAHLDSLTKPPGSLGRLEELACRYAAIKGILSPSIKKKTLFVFAADHGVTAEGVSAYPAEVTPQMVLNFLNGGAAINVLAAHVNAEVAVVDIGVNYDFGPCPGLIDKKIATGTQNMAKGPAMARRQAEQAIEIGIELAEERIRQGADILGTGDMGIGNTTAAAAIMSVYGNRNPEQVCGRGTGIDDETLKKKASVIEKA
ncbi:MAG: nicotinate-nucleotide--dimethylbenzimidazole phosphoribosyltransferase, partial [Nitrospinaceae bacterium]